MVRFGTLLLAASFFWGCSKSATPVAKPEPTPPKISPAEATANAKKAFDSLTSEFEAAQTEFMNKIRSAPRDQQMALFVSGGPQKEFASKFLELANEYPETDTHYEAIKLAAENGDAEVSTKAFDVIVKQYGNQDEKMVGLLEQFDRTVKLPAPYHEAFLHNLIDQSKNDAVKGAAIYTLVKLLQKIGEMKDVAGDQQTAGAMPKELVAYWLKDRGDNADIEMETLLANVAENYADVEFGSSGKLGPLAEEELFVFKYLSVGKIAPDIDGKDLDDQAFKLSDYRGKVVMLDFWGDW